MGDPSNNRFYREPSVPHASAHGSYRDEFNTTADYDNGFRAAVRLARVLMGKHWPEAMGWEPAPDLLGVITQLDHITAHLHGCFAGPLPRNRYANDDAAKDLYDTWSDQPGWVPWVERGNSIKQQSARDQIDKKIAHYHPDYAKINR